jgi:DNA-directed RNA polymerase subunit RPC12/RpoP
MSKTLDVAACARCGGPVWKFGRDPRSAEQRYRCKRCLHQFIPGRPARPRHQHPKVVCPKCGANMSLFKRLSDGFGPERWPPPVAGRGRNGSSDLTPHTARG